MTTPATPATALASRPPELAGARPFVARALLVTFVWGLAVLPAAFGIQQCSFARVLHTPCPGCGLTRAAHHLLAGDVVASLRMHPLVVPIILSNLVFALATMHATWKTGTPFYFYQERFGRIALWIVGCVYAAAILLWIARFFGALGGPVPV